MEDEKMFIIAECKEDGFLVQSYDEKEIVEMMKYHLKVKHGKDIDDLYDIYE